MVKRDTSLTGQARRDVSGKENDSDTRYLRPSKTEHHERRGRLHKTNKDDETKPRDEQNTGTIPDRRTRMKKKRVDKEGKA